MPDETPCLLAADALALVERRAFLKAEQARMEVEVKEIEAKLIACGPGKYQGTDGASAHVISPAPAVQLPKGKDENKAAVAEVRAIIGDDETFKKLFWFVGGYVLAKDFRTKAAVLLTPARLEKVIKRLETPGKPYVK